MALTYFQDFLRDDGSPITVKYSFRNLGGGGCEVDLVDVMPNTSEFEAWCAQSVAARFCADVIPMDVEIKAAKDAIDLTADECDRMIAWLAEHHEN